MECPSIKIKRVRAQYLGSNIVLIETSLLRIGFTFMENIQILHTSLRKDCSTLNQHLFSKVAVDSPLCRCGSLGSNQHYVFECRYYNTIRNTLFLDVSKLTAKRLKILLFGDEALSFADNESIFELVHTYIRESKILT